VTCEGLDSVLVFALPPVGVLAFLALHTIEWQFLPRARKGTFMLSLTAVVAYALVAGAAYGLCGLAVPRLVWTSGPVYAFLVMLYFHFYFGLDRSVSVRILGELVQAPDGRLSLAELDRVYPKRAMVTSRMDVLVAKGHVEVERGRYRCTPKGLRYVWFARIGKRLYNLDASG
jgi:hypothetical protein